MVRKRFRGAWTRRREEEEEEGGGGGRGGGISGIVTFCGGEP